MKNLTQKNWVKSQLEEKGFVTRNKALSMFCSRLGAIICDLKKEGYNIRGRNTKTLYGGDYLYELI